MWELSKIKAIGSAITTFNPRESTVPIYIPSGGKSRKKVPRPWQKGVEMIDCDE
jgi:hypothetical protein